MINQDDAEVGEAVWLRATTKQAPRECYLGLAAVVLDLKSAWPMVKVRCYPPRRNPSSPPADVGKEIWVHRMNVGLKPKIVKKDKQGDQVGGDDGVPAKVRVMGTPVVNIDGQDVLF